VRFKCIVFTLLNNEDRKAIATEVFATKISSESWKFAKMRNSLNTSDPILVSESRNSRFAKERKEQTPFLHCTLRVAVKDEMDHNNTPAETFPKISVSLKIGSDRNPPITAR